MKNDLATLVRRDLESLPRPDAASVRCVMRKHAPPVKSLAPEEMIQFAQSLIAGGGWPEHEVLEADHLLLQGSSVAGYLCAQLANRDAHSGSPSVAMHSRKLGTASSIRTKSTGPPNNPISAPSAAK